MYYIILNKMYGTNKIFKLKNLDFVVLLGIFAACIDQHRTALSNRKEKNGEKDKRVNTNEVSLDLLVDWPLDFVSFKFATMLCYYLQNDGFLECVLLGF